MTPRSKAISHCLHEVAASFGMTADDLIEDNRYEPVRTVRAIAVRVAWDVMMRVGDPSQERIAAVFKRDRSTVSWSLNKTRDSENQWLRRRITELVERIVSEIAPSSCPQDTADEALQKVEESA